MLAFKVVGEGVGVFAAAEAMKTILNRLRSTVEVNGGVSHCSPFPETTS